MTAEGNSHFTIGPAVQTGPHLDLQPGYFVLQGEATPNAAGVQTVRELANVGPDGVITIAPGVTAEEIVRAVAQITQAMWARDQQAFERRPHGADRDAIITETAEQIAGALASFTSGKGYTEVERVEEHLRELLVRLEGTGTET